MRPRSTGQSTVWQLHLENTLHPWAEILMVSPVETNQDMDRRLHTRLGTWSTLWSWILCRATCNINAGLNDAASNSVDCAVVTKHNGVAQQLLIVVEPVVVRSHVQCCAGV